ncbi:MAG: hypothetical protein ACRYHQ_35335 [Janthinobacterium lividum]
MRRMVVRYLVVAALALGALAGMTPLRAEAAVSAAPSVVHQPGSLVQTVQYYGYPGYYGRPRFYGGPRFYGPGPRYYGRRGFYGGPRFYGRGPGFYVRGPRFYGRRGYYR